MILKWHKNIVKVKHMKIKLDQDVLNAEMFKEWYVIATKTNLYFMGKEEYIFPISIISVVFTKNFIYYHSREDKNIYKLGHPLEEEVFMFYSPNYILSNVLVHEKINKIEDPTFVLSKNRAYVIKKRKTYFIYFIKHEGKLQHVIKECSFEDFIGLKSHNIELLPDDDLQINLDDSKDGIEFINKVNSSLDEKITNLNVEDDLKIYVYGDHLVAICNNLLTFINFLNFTERSINLINKTKTVSYAFNRTVDLYRPIRIGLFHNHELELVQVNDHLFHGTEIIKDINQSSLPQAFKKQKYLANRYPMFWTRPTSVDKQCMACLEPKDAIKLIVNCISSGTYDFSVIRLSDSQLKSIGKILENAIAKWSTLEEFVKYNANFMKLEDVKIIQTVKKCLAQNNYFSLSADYNSLLRIEYNRIFNYNSKILKNLKFSSILNLAYQIIFLEMNKNKMFKQDGFKAKKWEKYRKLFYKNFNDARMDEVNLLFNEKPKNVSFENEIENINEKAYVLRLSCSLGKSLAFYNSLNGEENFEGIELVYPMCKEMGQIINIDIKDKNWKNWPSFHYSCCSFLANVKEIDVSSCLIENKLKSFVKHKDESEHILGGELFAFGIQNRFKNIGFDEIRSFINDEIPLISMVLLINIGLNSRGVYNQDLFDSFNRQIHTDLHPYIRMGYFIGVSYTFMNSGNINLKNILLREINRKGALRSEKYNKNNVLYYDETYKLTLGFMMAYVFRDKKADAYEFIQLQNQLLELLVNGLVLFGSKTRRYIKKLKRTGCSTLEEIFYSKFFTLGCESAVKYDEIILEIEKMSCKLEIREMYRNAGALFYVGVSSIVNKKPLSEKQIAKFHDLCLNLEDRMLKDERYRIMFDYCLISLSLIKNSTCDLDLLKIIRRQIKRTERNIWDRNKNYYVFTVNGMVKEVQTNLTYGQIEKYKMCLGLLTLGLSRFKLESNLNTVIDLVIAFYINFPICTQDQDYFSLLRYNILNSLEKNKSTCFKLFCKFKGDKAKSREVSYYFKKKFRTLSEIDKKFVVDVLSDFYENYYKGEYLIDIEHFKEQVVRCK